MTATSGPGFCLMIETVQYAVMTETPVVIAFVQRLGPSTGGATQGAQGDVLLAEFCTSGGYTIPVFAPSSAADCYELTRRAFEWSERLRTPVVLLSDKEVGMTARGRRHRRAAGRRRCPVVAPPRPARSRPVRALLALLPGRAARLRPGRRRRPRRRHRLGARRRGPPAEALARGRRRPAPPSRPRSTRTPRSWRSCTADLDEDARRARALLRRLGPRVAGGLPAGTRARRPRLVPRAADAVPACRRRRSGRRSAAARA